MAGVRPVKQNNINNNNYYYYQNLFEPYVNDFFILPDDPHYCRTLKLEILTHIVNQENINKILKEFKVKLISILH